MRSRAERERLYNDNENLAFAALNEWTCRNRGFIERYRLERDDLEAVALAALWIATEKWNPARGQFSTLATLLVYSKMSHVLIPFTRQKRGSGAELPASLDAPVVGSEGITQADLLIAPLDDLPELFVLKQEERAIYPKLWAAVDSLRPKQAHAVRTCIGDGLTCTDAAARLGVSRQAVSRLVQSGLAELRDRCADLGLQN